MALVYKVKKFHRHTGKARDDLVREVCAWQDSKIRRQLKEKGINNNFK